MIGCAQIVEIQNDELAAGDRNVAVGGEAADAVVNGRCRRRVIDVNKPIDCEIRIECHSQEAALANRTHGERDEWRRQQHAVLDDAQKAVLLADKQTAIRCELHCGRRDEAARHERFSEPRWQCRGECHRRSGDAQEKDLRGESQQRR